MPARTLINPSTKSAASSDELADSLLEDELADSLLEDELADSLLEALSRFST